MRRLNEFRQMFTDPPKAQRVAYLVEPTDVGVTQGFYLGQHNYVFVEDDVGRLVEVTKFMSPNSVSWRFGSVFKDLREQYPETKPYLGAPSAKE